MLGLSATIPNIRELADWLTALHRRPIKTIEENKRPVPLHLAYQCQGKIFDHFQHLVKEGYKNIHPVPVQGRRFFKEADLKPNKPSYLIKHLAEQDLLPCIYFVFSRRRTEFLAEEMKSFNFLSEEEHIQITALYDKLCETFDLTDETSAQNLRLFIERGIAYHHAGMLPTLKEAVERLFTSRLIKVIFTTETFALGINMPARTVIFDELRKFYGTSFGPMKTRDFYQMAGRAGRRSIDAEGFVFCRVTPQYISSSSLYRIIHGQPEKVVSRFNASYATLLNLYQKFGEKLYDIYPRSFHYFQENKNSRRKALEHLRTKVNLLKTLGHIQAGQLTEKGIFAGRVYGYELLLAELFSTGVLEELSETALGVLSVSVVFEPRKGERKPLLSPCAQTLETTTSDVTRGLHCMEQKFQARPLSKSCYYHLAPALEAWLKGESFEKILRYADSDEGEVVRYFRMAIQILREINEAPISLKMRGKIHRLIKLINRDTIDAEKQLRS